MREFADSEDFRAAVGQNLGTSEWHLVDQTLIDRFAEVTGDRQWIHTDRARATASGFGATVAHGFLTVALLPALLREIFLLKGVDMTINKGLRRLSFAAPVTAGQSVRANARLLSARPRPRDFTEAVLFVRIEVTGKPVPCATAELVMLLAKQKLG